MILCSLILYQALDLFFFFFFFFTMLQESSNISFILTIILPECHVTLQLSTLFPTKLKQKSMKRTNIIAGFLLSSAVNRAYVPSTIWFEVTLAVLPFYSLKLLLSANYCPHHDFPDLHLSRIFLPSQFNY